MEGGRGGKGEGVCVRARVACVGVCVPLSNLVTTHHPRERIADLAPSWVDARMLVPAAVLHTPAAKLKFEVEVMPPMINTLASMLFEPFKAKLLSLSDQIVDEAS